jgi:hypothetical protein
MAWVVEAAATQLDLSWSDNADNEDGFNIERRNGASGIFAEIATVGADAEFFTDSGLTQGATYCYRVRAFNGAGDSAYSNEACGTAPRQFSLSVVRAGTGSGRVDSTPPGIGCGSDCSEVYFSDTSVILTATPAAGSTFSGWSGGGCSGGGPCTVSLVAGALVTATFAPQLPAGDTGSSSAVIPTTAMVAAPYPSTTVDSSDQAGSSEATDFPVASPLTLTSLTADHSSPQPPGTTFIVAAAATGGTEPYQYKWWLFDGATWTLAQDWSTSNAYAWTPTVAHPTYGIGVWVRSATNRGDSYDRAESSGAIGFAIESSPDDSVVKEPTGQSDGDPVAVR